MIEFVEEKCKNGLCDEISSRSIYDVELLKFIIDKTSFLNSLINVKISQRVWHIVFNNKLKNISKNYE